MNTITQKLTEIVAQAFAECGYDKTLGAVSVSDRKDLCQFQCNGAFAAAKIHKKAPFIVAEEVASLLRESPAFERVEVVNPGFINLTLYDSYLMERVNEIARDKNLGIPWAEEPQTIVIDYGGANVAKPLHIGHLRSAIIGEALKRLAKANGNQVISDVHLGDWGFQIGLVIAELEERNPEWRCFDHSFIPEVDPIPKLDVDTLNEVYPLASQKSKADELFKKKAQNATLELQKGRPGYVALWKEILQVSVDDLRVNYGSLSVEFDLWYGESDAEQYSDTLMEILTARGLLYKSEGAMVVDVMEEGDTAPIPPVIIKKTDNSSIYATTDLATIIQRQKDFAPAKIWYVVDNRQELHFTQVFRCARKAELVPGSTELEFLGFGTMNGSDGKPYKTRDGGVMRLSDLLETVTNAAYNKLTPENFSSQDDRWEVARKVGVAAVKFGDLINHRAKDYIFDLDKFLNFEGKTGSYLLYTITRINSILRKIGVERDVDLPVTGVYTGVEREIFLAILLTGDAFEHALEEKAPNYIAENAHQLAMLFSRFYHDNHIAHEPDEIRRNSWIGLMVLTRKLLLKHLEVLGIEAVERM